MNPQEYENEKPGSENGEEETKNINILPEEEVAMVNEQKKEATKTGTTFEADEEQDIDDLMHKQATLQQNNTAGADES